MKVGQEMNKKGQALVEFVIILPVFLILMFSIIDFSRVISLKNELENKASDAITLYENGKNDYEISTILKKQDSKINFSLTDDGTYITVILNEKINPMTPGFNYLPSKIFNVEVKRVFNLNENEITTTSEEILEETITTKSKDGASDEKIE